MEIQRIAVKRIRRAAYNPRKTLKPGDPEYEKLKRSMSEFGYVEGLVWNETTGNLVGGHQRLSVLVDCFAAKAVDVCVVRLPLVKEKSLNLALNKITGEWDTLALAELLEELRAEELVDVGLSGFDEQEIDAAIAEALVMGDAGEESTCVGEISRPYPKTAWMLVGLPFDRWSQIAPLAEELAARPGYTVETAYQ
jgi:ParB-like chromosome segregation protein Spo0J